MKFQGKGIGRLLLDFAQQKAKEQGYKRIVIWAFRDNYRAVSFLLKNGGTLALTSISGENIIRKVRARRITVFHGIAGNNRYQIQFRHDKDKLPMRAECIIGIIALKRADPPLVAIGTGAIPRAVVLSGGGFCYPLGGE